MIIIVCDRSRRKGDNLGADAKYPSISILEDSHGMNVRICGGSMDSAHWQRDSVSDFEQLAIAF
jgi:hypothetical protein